MADLTVTQTLYAMEFTKAYEQKESWLRGTVTTKGEVHGESYIFIIEGAADLAVERGANGNIPYAADDQNSATCTLKEYHHLARKNHFKIAASSVDQRSSMAGRGVTAINYRTDQLIITELDTATYQTNSGSAAANSLALMLEGRAILDANYVPDDGERYGILTPMAMAQAMRINQFTSSDWVPDRPYMKLTQWRNWMGIKWAMHPNLPGKGTSSASCYVYHKFAVGHALNKGAMQSVIGDNGEHDYAWARSSSYQGAKALQGAGIVEMLHNDTAALS